MSQFKSIFRLCIILIPVILLWGFTHEYYLSIANLKYDRQDEALEMSAWYFADDLLLSLRKEVNSEIEWEDPQGKTEQALQEYLHSHLYLISEDGIKIYFQWVGMQFKGELVYVYMQKSQKPYKRYKLHNSVLVHDFPNQKNIVHFDFETEKETYYFDENKLEIKLMHK